ncbi:DUF4190 domain-containing protein [Micromonospora sp. WMMA1363]|uniref:DUF4190 domain-containing protein n=1 Tax=Micromonospora sp. WMMA1363 TaxID=3053985 RepID=UPI00259CD08D|nr:DUF4190 domain-containing protein [Micromonospora sp. WMMA1363]MDM4722354.1 DUF4190 domain-containing protein [Micromonospora sp. WMMA1363]
MTYNPPSGGWQDPAWSGQQSTPPADPTLPVSGQPVPAQPTGGDPYAPTSPYASPYADPYAGVPQAAGHPTPDPYAGTGYPPPAYPGYGHAPPRTNSMAIIALVLSLVGIASCITAPIGAILGHLARKQIRQTGEGGDGMAKAAIIVGWILTGLLALLIAFYVVVIIFAIASESSSGSSF